MGGATSKQPGPQNENPTPVKITNIDWQLVPPPQSGIHVTYTVSCDLTSVLTKGNLIDAEEVELKPASGNSPPPPSPFDGPGTVTNVSTSTIEATLLPPTPPMKPPSSNGNSAATGTINSVSCPSEDSNNSLTVTITVVPIPHAPRAYLYLRKDAFYSDAINVSVGSDGLLSSSDTSSVQQITAIINELAQTAATAGFNIRGLANKPTPPPKPNDQDNRRACFTALNDLVKYGPYYNEFALSKNIDQPLTTGTPPIVLRVEPLVPRLSQSQSEQTDYVEVEPGVPGHPGLIAFFPVPAEVEIVCKARPQKVYLSEPMKLNLYTDSHFLNPERDFLTGPQDTLTFSSGFIVGHKYSDQSPAKTIVDTVTSPIRALIPSTSVTQSVSVSDWCQNHVDVDYHFSAQGAVRRRTIIKATGRSQGHYRQKCGP